VDDSEDENEGEPENDLGVRGKGVTNVTLLIVRHLTRYTTRYKSAATRYIIDNQRLKPLR
jgi:hypothetical protein